MRVLFAIIENVDVMNLKRMRGKKRNRKVGFLFLAIEANTVLACSNGSKDIRTLVRITCSQKFSVTSQHKPPKLAKKPKSEKVKVKANDNKLKLNVLD
jgi:hypothetical protein